MEKSTNLPIFSVSDFIAVVNQTFEYAYPNVLIEGEVASFKINQSKFVFFDIKDKTGSIGCFMTVWQLRMPIEDGMKIIVSAVPRLTEWGKFSLTVKSFRPSGEGALKKSFEILKAKLEAEGLFALERKRQLPRIPEHVAVISSTQSAGYADFIKILNDRWGGILVDVAHVQVQGDGAPDQIIRAVNYFNQQKQLPDVIVIVRGGGSADDLSTFNDEPLVRAIAASRIPTLVGVGHEIDESLADKVADVRAATPSNAAQILVPDRFEVIRAVHAELNSLLPRIMQMIDRQKDNIGLILKTVVNKIDLIVDERINKTISLKNVLVQLDPNKILARGYALLRGALRVGEMVEVETNKVIMNAEVKNVVNK
jgi:exodeoxyribonuclease VII large subunit